MFAPRFSLRLLLLLMTLCAGVFFVVARTYQGEKWAFGVMLGLFCLAAAVMLQGVLFAVALALGAIGAGIWRPAYRAAAPAALGSGAPQQPVSPFAASPPERAGDSTSTSVD